MPAPRKPSTEEQLARTANAKRIGPSTKTIASLRIMDGASGSEADERQGKTFYEVCFEKGHSTAYYLYCLFAGDTDIFNVLSEAMPEGCCSNSTQGSKDPTKQQVKRSSKKRKHNESDGSGGNTTVAVQMRESDSLADSICYMQVLKRCVMFHVNL